LPSPVSPWPAGRPLREWQRAAADAILDHSGESFLDSATPAAGKTTLGRYVAWRLLSAERVRRVAIVAPTTHICRQWALDAARYGYTEALLDGVCRPVTFHT
jgi:superfamily II DNA or RNA helicase